MCIYICICIYDMYIGVHICISMYVCYTASFVYCSVYSVNDDHRNLPNDASLLKNTYVRQAALDKLR